MSGTTNLPSQQHVSAVTQLSNDELAVKLIQCAAMVKKGEKGQLVRDTIYDLTFYLTGKMPNGARTNTSTVTQTQQQPSEPQQSTETIPQAPSSPRIVQKSSLEEQQRNEHVPMMTVPTAPVSETPSIPATLSDSNSLDESFVSTQDQHVAGGTVSKHRASPIKQVLGRVVAGDFLPERSHATKAATSEKNAARARSDIAGMRDASIRSLNSNSSGGHHSQNAVHARPGVRPAFHRPTNPNSPLIANGWIEQHRRSKMRSVWKEVLASLVEGRKPGEETTFWIQRETGTFNNGKPELEALHQIPVKWITEVRYEEYSSDFRFTLRLSNISDEFVFRCSRNEEAAQNWVLTLRSANEIALRNLNNNPNVNYPRTALDSWETSNNQSSIEDEKKLPDNQFQQPTQQPTPTAPVQPQHQQPPPTQQDGSSATTQRMSIKELRAIAHGAGVMTHGMERRDLERVVEGLSRASRGNAPPPPPPQPAPVPPTQQTASPPTPVAQNVQAPTPPSALPNESATPPAFAVRPGGTPHVPVDEQRQKEEDHRRLIAERIRQQQQQQLQQQELEKRRREEEERKRLEQERLRKEEEAHLKRVADMQAAAERQRQDELQRKQQQQWQQQQQEWQRQQAEMRAADERRRQEEAARVRQQQQQWQQQQQQQVPPNVQQQQWRNGPIPNPFAPSVPFNGGHPPNQQHPAGPPGPQYGQHNDSAHQRSSSAPHQHPQQPSAANIKYAKMAQQTEDDNSVALHAIKHGVLLQWALCPPTMQMLKPIEHLLAEMPNVFPPKFNVPKHDHFTKWTPIRPEEVCASPGRPDPEKLNKMMRKLRLFLHPDKLPRDFSKEQEHLCKLLWDITSDAYEDFKKNQDELSWVRS